MEVGFSQPLYSVDEGETVEVCVEVFSPDVIDGDVFALLGLSSSLGTASG